MKLNLHPSQLDQDTLLGQCDVRRQRRSGPGGQHRNKVETGVFLVHRPTKIGSQATERRSQKQNLQLALARLRVNLALGHRGANAEEYPSPLWQQRCQHGRIAVSPSHPDLAPLLAEALDVLAHHDWQPPRAAEQLGCSTSQLIKFLRRDPRGLAELNRRRRDAGLPKLH